MFVDLLQCSRDLYGQHFSETWFLIQRLHDWHLPLWLPNERMGQPFLALLYTEVLYPPRVVFALLLGELRGPNWMHFFHALFAFAGSFLAARRLGLNRAAAFVSAVPFALGPAFVVFAQNLQFAASAAWAGWNLWAALRVKTSPTPRRIVVLALTMTGAVFAGAPEMALWQGVMVVLVCGLRGLFASLWSAVASAVLLLPAAELAREYTTEGLMPAGHLEWSASLPQLISFAIPDADRPRGGEIWGTDEQWFWASLFIGTATVILAAASVSRRRARPLLWLALGCALLALGQNLGVSAWLLQWPVLRAFRYPAKYAIGSMFAVSMLAGVGLQRLQASGRRWWPYGGFVIGLGAGLLIASRVHSVRDGFVSGAEWALFIAVLLVATLATVGRRGVTVLVAFEALLAPRQPLILATPAMLSAPSTIAQTLRAENAQRVSLWVDRDEDEVPWCEPTDAAIVVRTSKQRLSTLRFIEENIHAIGGYGFRDPPRPARAFEQGPTAYALAGVTHFVLNTWESPPVLGPTPERTDVNDVWVWKSSGAFERSWFVERAVEATDDQALAALAGPAERFRHEVLGRRASTGSARTVGAPGCESPVTLTEPQPEVIVEQVEACQDGYVVLADSWYPGWQVTIDGVEAAAFKADYFLRAVAVPQGHHEVIWRYQPWSLRLGALLSLLAFASMALACSKRFGHLRA